jgi:uncharacterized membrane protein YhaH (DUF805 family)
MGRDKMGFFKLLFSFKGRATRAQFWLGSIAPLVVFALLALSMGSTIAHFSASPNPDPMSVIGAIGFQVILVLAGLVVCIWITAALYTKRLHDRNKSAIWLLAIYLPPVMGVMSLIFVHEAIIIMGLLCWVSNLWNFIELGCMSGTPGPNRFDDANHSAYLDDTFGERPSTPTQKSYGGMAGAMAAVEAAARATPPPALTPQNAYRAAAAQSMAQFGASVPQGFGRKNVPPSNVSFGRR